MSGRQAVHADEKLTVFLERESAIRANPVNQNESSHRPARDAGQRSAAAIRFRAQGSFPPALPQISGDRHNDRSPQPLPVLLYEPRYTLRDGYVDLNRPIKCPDDKRCVPTGNVDVCRQSEVERLWPMPGWSDLPCPACALLARDRL
jgi:hypothetical protein